MGIFGYIKDKKQQFKEAQIGRQQSKLEQDNIRLEKERQAKAKLDVEIRKREAINKEISSFDERQKRVAPTKLQQVAKGFKAAQQKQKSKPSNDIFSMSSGIPKGKAKPQNNIFGGSSSNVFSGDKNKKKGNNVFYD